jgi:hypothetical protein
LSENASKLCGVNVPEKRTISWEVSDTLKPLNARDFVVQLNEVTTSILPKAAPNLTRSDLPVFGRFLVEVLAGFGIVSAVGLFFWLLDILCS